MLFSVKKLTEEEKAFCLKTVSAKAFYALVTNAIARKESLSVVRVADGEHAILVANPKNPFTTFDALEGGAWNTHYGIQDMPVSDLQESIRKAGNTCTYFAPSLSGISLPQYLMYNFFEERPYYIDNFYPNEWTKTMVQQLLTSAGGAFIIHSKFELIIENFKKNYKMDGLKFEGVTKKSWRDNKDAITAACTSHLSLVLFSGGPAGKIMGPEIAKNPHKIVLDIGNTLIPWSERMTS